METALYILCYILISVVIAVLGVLVPIWTKTWYKDKKIKAKNDELYKEAIKDLLRGEMLFLYNEAKNNDNRVSGHYNLECFMRMYNTYHNLGGNSFIDEVKEKYIRFEIISENKGEK